MNGFLKAIIFGVGWGIGRVLWLPISIIAAALAAYAWGWAWMNHTDLHAGINHVVSMSKVIWIWIAAR